MGFEARFPRAARVIRLGAATFIPGLLFLFFVAYIFSETPVAARPEELERFAFGRVVFVMFVALFSMALGLACGEMAFPSSAKVPSILGASLPFVFGVIVTLDGFQRWGILGLEAFVLVFVAPEAYVLGALWRQRRLRTKAARAGG